MRTGILGCGNAGLALYALMLEDPGFEPVLYSSPDHLRTLNRMLSSESPILFRYNPDKDPAELERESFRVSHSFEGLLSDCDILINTLPVEAHIGVFDELHRILMVKNRRIHYINLVGGFAIFDHFLKQNHNKIARLSQFAPKNSYF